MIRYIAAYAATAVVITGSNIHRPGPLRYIAAYAATAVVMVALDLLWLGLIARSV